MSGGDELQEPTFEGYQPWPPPQPPPRRGVGKIVALVAGVLVLAAITSFAGWQGVGLVNDRGRAEVQARADADRAATAAGVSADAAQDRKSAMTAAAATATKLTGIGWRTIDADIKAILASSTGSFHDDFATRSQAFADVVRSNKSESTGTVNQSGVESIGDGRASVLVAITVETRNDGAKQQPKAWRMRITLQRKGDDYLTSNVEFVP